MFAVQVEYLLGRSYSGTVQDRGEAEWPPHPLRLFNALVAASYNGGFGEAGREALRWLENQGDPLIRAGSGTRAKTVQCFVPANDEATGPAARREIPRVFPSVGLDDCCVEFAWLNADPPVGVRQVLGQIAASVGYLGRAASVVRVSVLDTYAAEFSHIPDEAGEMMLRVAIPGRLEELERAFEHGRRPPFGSQRPYRDNVAAVGDLPTHGVFDEMVVMRFSGVIRLPVEACLTITDVMRRALILLADGAQVLSSLIHGHNRPPHLAFVALPYAGTEHADGRILGVAVVLPADTTIRERRQVLLALSSLRQINLGALGEVGVELADEENLPRNLHSSAWTGPSRYWSTVTPLLLDRFPKRPGKGLTAGEIISSSCQRVGLPVPSRIRYGRYSRVKGIPPVSQFRLRREEDDIPRMAVHAELEFPAPVEGPILIGAGRYFGLGLLRPFGENEVAE